MLILAMFSHVLMLISIYSFIRAYTLDGSISYSEMLVANIVILMVLLMHTYYHRSRLTREYTLFHICAIVYVGSTTFRTAFPVMQETKACYRQWGALPYVDRLVATVGEMCLAVKLSLIVGMTLHTVGWAMRHCALVFLLLTSVILVSEVLCFIACWVHPVYHEDEITGWKIFTALILVFQLISVRSRRLAQIPPIFNITVLSIILCVITLMYLKFWYAPYNTMHSSMPYHSKDSMLHCGFAAKESWDVWIRSFAYAYFVFASSVCALLCVLLHEVSIKSGKFSVVKKGV